MAILLFAIVVMLMISGISPIALAANLPSGIVVDSTRNVFSSDGTNSHTLSFTAAENGFSPAGIAIDPSGHVFVGDGSNNRILKISNIGEFIREWGTAGSENDQYNAPIGAAVVSQGHVFIAVGGNQRIRKFSNTDDFIRAWNSTSSRSLRRFTLVTPIA